MSQTLRRDICRLQNHGTRGVEIDRQTIDNFFPAELRYSRRYWAHHTAQCIDSSNVVHGAFEFLGKHFLHWVEAMSLLDLVSEVVVIINLLQLSLQVMFAISYIGLKLIDTGRSPLQNVRIPS
jgi:hypothetical protein